MQLRWASLTGKCKHEERSVEIAHAEHTMCNRSRSIKWGVFGCGLLFEQGGSLHCIQDGEWWSCKRNNRPWCED